MQQDFAHGSRLRNPRTQSQPQQQGFFGPLDIVDSIPAFAASDWLLLLIVIELAVIIEQNGGLF